MNNNNNNGNYTSSSSFFFPLSLTQAASILGATGVALGAWGAHGLAAKLAAERRGDSWRTAVLYQLFHATAIVGVAALAEHHDNNGNTTTLATTNRWTRVGQLWTVGTTLFSGSIYLLCLNAGPKKLLGPSTPLGGLILISGWVLLGFCE